MIYKYYLTIALLLSTTSSLIAQQKNRHIVQKGETIESIAHNYKVTVAELQEANPDINTFFYVGLKLNIPSKVQNISTESGGSMIKNNLYEELSKAQDIPLRTSVIDNKLSNNTTEKAVTKKEIQTIQNETTSLIQVIHKVDSIYNTGFETTNLINTFDVTKLAITNYIQALDMELIQQLQTHYYESFYNASEKEQLDSAIVYAFKYLMSDGKKDESIIWKFLVDNYGCDGDTEKTKFLIDRFNDLSMLHDNAYREQIDLLSAKYKDVIHPVSFDDMAKGYWISLINNINNTPRYILQINNVTVDEGTKMLLSPKIPWKSEKTGRFWYYSPSYENYFLRTSQTTFCDADSKSLHLAFATEKINEGNTQRSQQNLASNRQWKADMHGKINSSNTSFGNKLAAGVATDVMAGLLDALAISMGAGSKIAEGYGIELNAISSKVMNAGITYRRVKESSYGYTSLKDYKPNQRNRFVKWEESDSVIFISPQGEPIFIESLSKDSPLLKDYNDVIKKHNLGRPQYLFPTLVSLGIGAYFIAKSYPLVVSDEDKYSDEEIKSRVTKGWCYFAIGTIVPCITIPIITGIILSKRQSAYNKINKKNMDKMRQKAAQFSMQPILNPIDNSVGMNMSLNF